MFLLLLLLLFYLITWSNIWRLYINWCLFVWVGVLRIYRRLVMRCRGGGSFLLGVVVALPFGGISLGRLEDNGIRSPSRWRARFQIGRASCRERV